jgi:hypothetical protein
MDEAPKVSVFPPLDETSDETNNLIKRCLLVQRNRLEKQTREKDQQRRVHLTQVVKTFGKKPIQVSEINAPNH